MNDKSESGYDYDGDDINIEEMPQGCIVSGKNGVVVIASTKDVLAIMESLVKYLQVRKEKDII